MLWKAGNGAAQGSLGVVEVVYKVISSITDGIQTASKPRPARLEQKDSPGMPAGGNTRRLAMKNMTRSLVVLAAIASFAGTMSFAQSGEAVYKAHCQSCHGATGTPNPGIAKLLGVKPASDPSVKKMTVAEMEDVVKHGKNKMKPVTGLSDAEVKDVVMYFRTLK